MKRKCLAVGIILLFIGTTIIPSTIGSNTINSYEKNLYDKESSPLQENVTVTITSPENAIYWNEHKIVPFPVPLILHGDNPVLVRFKIEPLNEINQIELYFNNVLQMTITIPPFPDSVILFVPFFSHAKATIIAYSSHGQGSGEITVWRLFP
jgi:hypothetical protein